MKGFNFRLESVLTLRRHREESLQCALAGSERALEAEIARLESIREEMALQAERIGRQQTVGILDVNLMCLEHSYMALLERRMSQQAGAVKQMAQQVASDREAVIGASRDKKALERVREGLLLSFGQETARAEQKVADEMATTRHQLRRELQPWA